MNTNLAYEEIDATLDRLIVPSFPGWCTPEKAKRIARLAGDIRASLVVELGVFGGRSLVALAFGLTTHKSGRVHGIDPYTKAAAMEGTNAAANDEWWGTVPLEDIRNYAIKAVGDNGLQPYVTMIRERSQDMVDRYKDGSIDLLHQDSNHSPEVSCKEVRDWMPKLRVGGFWIFDDIDWESTRDAQQLLIKNGFVVVERYDSWAIFQSVGATLKGC